MNKNNPKVKVISVKEAGKMNKNNIAYFTLTDGTVAVVQKDEQKKQEEIKGEENSVYQKYKKNKQINQINQINNIQPKHNINSNYEVFKIKNSYQNNNNNNYHNINYLNNNGYQIIEAIPVKFCENPKIRNFSQPEPVYVQPYLNPDIIYADFQFNDNMNNN